MHSSVCFAKRDERASAVRERNLNKRARAQPQHMGEAPVKYELTGASGHLRAEARGVA